MSVSKPELQRLRELAKMLPHRMAAKDVLWAVEYIEVSNEEGRLAEAEIDRLREALEYYADKFGGDTASKALRGVNERMGFS